MNKIIDVIIPAYNEEKSIALVLGDIPSNLVREVVVCNNASKDRTAEIAAKARSNSCSSNPKRLWKCMFEGD